MHTADNPQVTKLRPRRPVVGRGVILIATRARFRLARLCPFRKLVTREQPAHVELLR
jgi:hypothetical protein